LVAIVALNKSAHHRHLHWKGAVYLLTEFSHSLGRLQTYQKRFSNFRFRPKADYSGKRY
jgi:hypothetical protein